VSRTRRVGSNDAVFTDYIAALQIVMAVFRKLRRKIAENTVKHRCGGGGLMVANHRGVGESSMVVTTLYPFIFC